MKKKKTKLLIILLLFLLSIGFAYLTTNLDISGLAILKKSVWDVHFEHIQTEYDKASINIPANITNNKLTVNFDVTLSSPGEIYSFYVDVVNNSTFDVMIENVEFTNLDDSLSNIIIPSVTYDDGISLKNNDLLKENAKEVLRVEVKYKDSITLDELPKEDKDFNLSLTITYSQANSKAKERTKIEVLSRKTPGELSVGDEIKIGDEHFYVTSSNKDTTVLLAKYNLNVGYNTQDGSIGIQNELSIGNGSEIVDNRYFSVVPFSSKAYWSTEDRILNKYGQDWYNNNIYDEDISDQSGDNYSIAYYVKDYVNYLNNLGLNNIKGRLITYNELLELGCIYTESLHHCGAAPDFLRITTFWTGTAASSSELYYIDIRGYFWKFSYEDTRNIGIRPIIEIPTTQLANDVVITFDANGGENITSAKVSKKMFDTLEDDYYEAYSGPDDTFRRLRDANIEKIDDQESPTGTAYKVTLNENIEYIGAYWPAPALSIGEEYKVEATAKGVGTWEIGHEQVNKQVKKIALTNKYEKYEYKIHIEQHSNHAMVFYRRKAGGTIDDYVNVASFKITHLLPEATNDGQIFLGWYTERDGGTRITSDTIVTKDTTYYAHWKKYYIDVNVYIDNTHIDALNYTGELKDAIKFDFYLNNELKGNQVKDINLEAKKGDTYEIKNIVYDKEKYKLLSYDAASPLGVFANPHKGTIDTNLINGLYNHAAEYVIINLFFESIE